VIANQRADKIVENRTKRCPIGSEANEEFGLLLSHVEFVEASYS
jgi:hypothetical protein